MTLEHKLIARRRYGATLAIALISSGLSAGCTSLGPVLSQSDVAARVARYRTCPAAGVFADTEVGRGQTWPDGKITIGPITTRFVFPDQPGWQAPEPLPGSVLLAPQTWTAPPSLKGRHAAFRARVGRPDLSGTVHIALFEDSEHWTTAQTSTFAVRDKDGGWRIDSVQETNVGEDSAPVRTDNRRLSEEAGARLDAILADPCLDAEPPNLAQTGEDYAIFPHFTLEIVRQRGRLVFAGPASASGRVGEIVHLILYSEPEP